MGGDVAKDPIGAVALMPLNRANLETLPKGISRPKYRASDLSSGIVHIGLGNFHRAHQSWYLHRLMQDGHALDWAITGAGVRSYDAEMRRKLMAQDCLTTLIQLDPSETSAEVVGPMIDYIPIEPDNSALIATLTNPATRIVSLTVTEGGYFIDPSTGEFDADHAEIRHDAAKPRAPKTAFGAIIQALVDRRAEGIPPFSVQSCDNLLGNGEVAKQALVSLARLTDQGLAHWIEDRVSCPGSMVDCIVPATGPNEIELVRSLGVDDQVPVTHENFRQWVIEDQFHAGRPEWERVGATMTKDVHAYEEMKIRVLNAGHQMIANSGEILGLRTIAACMAEPLVAGFLDKVQKEEVLPFVSEVPEMSREDYLRLVARRFSNPAVHDTTRRVAFDGSSRHTGFVLPTLRDALAAGAPVEGLALVEALWARMCLGRREDGSEIEPNDPFWSQLKLQAQAAKEQPVEWLNQGQIYGSEAGAEPFRKSFCQWLDRIYAEGVRSTLRGYLAG